MATIFHNDVNFQKCPKCNGQLKSASYDPVLLDESSVISCEDCFLSGSLKFTDESYIIEWKE